MINSTTLKRATALAVPLLFLIFTVFTACEKEKTKTITKVVHDTLTVVEKDTIVINIISVDTVLAFPDSVTQGLKIDLTAEVSTMPAAGPLSYVWTASAGELVNNTKDTVTWTSPSEVGVYKIYVHVTDGVHIAIGSTTVGVGMYRPTVEPYYVGDEVCGTCHTEKHSEWAQTAHAGAWATLMANPGAAPYCFPCHSVGYAGPAGNSGFDEVPIAKFENVQCENCHGPGSEHITNPINIQMGLSFNVDVCGQCHEGGHHPYVDQWSQSLHSFDPYTAAHGAPTRGGCQGCHEGVTAAMRINSTETAFFNGSSGTARDTTSYHGINGDMGFTIPIGLQPIVCAVCHNPHSAANPGQLRTEKAVTFIGGQTATGAGAGQLCMQCHHARHDGEEQVPEGDAHLGPHPSTQGDVVFGISGYEAISPTTVWASTGHHNIQDVCAACHVYQTDFDPVTQTTNTGHTFQPRVAACEQCHGQNISAFTDIMAAKDYDGDGNVEGLQIEVEDLMSLLAQTLINADVTDTLMGTDPTVDVIVGKLSDTVGDTSALAVKLRSAGYNLVFAYDDNSKGIHNPAYVVQLLQQSILYLDPNALPPAAIFRGGPATTFAATVPK